MSQMDVIVGHCPVCDAPVYGPEMAVAYPCGAPATVPVRFACDCRSRLVARLDLDLQVLRLQLAKFSRELFPQPAEAKTGQ